MTIGHACPGIDPYQNQTFLTSLRYPIATVAAGRVLPDVRDGKTTSLIKKRERIFFDENPWGKIKTG